MSYLVQQTTCSDSAALANSHTSQNGHICSYPAIFFNHDISSQCWAPATGPSLRVDGVRCADKLDVRTENTSGPDVHCTGIRNAAVGSDENIISNGDVVAVVTVKRRFNGDTLTNRAERE